MAVTNGIRPTIAVVMGTYNGARFLSKQIDSILNQTMMPDEIVIVDDCSTDDTQKIINDFAAKYPQIKPFRNELNIGLNRNYEKAASLSTCDYIFFSDQDDIWSLDKIEKMITFGAGLDFVYSDAQVINEVDQIICKSELHDYHQRVAVSGNSLWYFLITNCVSGHNLMISRSLLQKSLPIPETVLCDNWLAIYASVFSSIHYLDSALCLHRIHGNNFFNNPDIHKKSPRIGKKQRFFNNSNRYRRLIAELQLRGGSTEELKLLIKHFERFDQLVFDVDLFIHMLKHRQNYYPGARLTEQVNRFFKFCRCKRGYWLPSLKL